MLTKETFLPLLRSLDYREVSPGIYEYEFATGSRLGVDFNKEEFIYPSKIKLHRETTKRFNWKGDAKQQTNESFVVFECVHQLLLVGYSADRIELEKTASLGHGRGKALGYADVFVNDHAGKPFTVIECKTSGKEFDGEWKAMLNDGGQVFTYASEAAANRTNLSIVLYTSDFANGTFSRNAKTIPLYDNTEHIQLLRERGLTPLTYEKAGSARELFEVWSQTYGKAALDSDLFTVGSPLYDLNQKPRTLANLPELSTEEYKKKQLRFQEILRKHSISSLDQAFNKLLNLFIAKIVDEIKNPDGLKFYWGGVASDSKFGLVERLQDLYAEGMSLYLNERVENISREEVKEAFHPYQRELMQIEEEVNRLFNRLKFYSDNYFAFIDVHNEELFEQNGEILIEMVELVQDLKLTTSTQHQFLGDLFEFLLDQGVKQSEGQYFTPLPIVRFITASLPLQEFVSKTTVPTVLDYACGSGHFLNEYANQLLDTGMVKDEALPEYHAKVYGIEKEARLAKVSKVASLMYGQRGINIINANALIANEQVKDASVDILLANPPYAVKGFLENLTIAQRKRFSLYEDRDITNLNAIEEYFLELSSILMKTGGVAGIVVPSSILNKDGIYARGRKILLRNFEFVAIFASGQGTFGKTGVETVTLFLRKKRDTYKTSEHIVEEWYRGNYGLEAGVDESWVREAFATKVERTVEEVLGNRQYQSALTDYHFLRTTQTVPVIIIKTPDDNKARKEFLGYDWSDRKGSQGIKYLNGSVDKLSSPLYNPADLKDPAKLNSMIQQNFAGKFTDVPEELTDYAVASDLITMFGATVSLSSPININVRAAAEIDLKNLYSVSTSPLAQNAEIVSGVTFGKTDVSTTETGKQVLTADNIDLLGNFEIKKSVSLKPIFQVEERKKLKANDIFISLSSASKRHVGKVALIQDGQLPEGSDYYAGGFMSIIRSTNYPPELLAAILQSPETRKWIENKIAGSSIQNLSKHLPSLPIPYYSPAEIKETVAQLREAEVTEANFLKELEKLKLEEEEVYQNAYAAATGSMSLADEKAFSLLIGKRILKQEEVPGGKFPVYSANVFKPFGNTDKKLLTDFNEDSVLWGIDGDWMTNHLPAGEPFYPTDHCGVIRVNAKDRVDARYLAFAVKAAGVEVRFSRSNRASIQAMKRLTIPVPPFSVQQEARRRVEDIHKQADELAAQLASARYDRKNLLPI